jgi:DNA-binding beta-propeller fold protein YncE
MTAKRQFSASDDSDTGTAKRLAVGDTVSMATMLRRLGSDPASFFSTVPADVRTALRPFVNLSGHVKDPRTLRFCSQIAVPVDFGYPRCFCFDRDDNIVLVHYAELNNVCVYDKSGLRLRKMVSAPAQLSVPVCCAVDFRGRLFMTDADGDCVHVFRVDGRLEYTIFVGYSNGVHELALSRDDSVLYVAAYRAGAVKSYCAADGTFLYDIGAGFLKRLFGVAVLSNGHIAAISDVHPSAVHIFTADGAHVRSFDVGVGDVRQIVVDQDDNMYVANGWCDNVAVFSADGQAICSFGGKGKTDGKFKQPGKIAIDSTGVVAVADKKRLQLFKCV